MSAEIIVLLFIAWTIFSIVLGAFIGGFIRRDREKAKAELAKKKQEEDKQ